MLKALEIHTARNKVIVSVLSNLTAKFFDSSIQQFTIIRSSFRSRFSFKSFRSKTGQLTFSRLGRLGRIGDL